MDWEPAAHPYGANRLMPRNLQADPESRRRICDVSLAMCRRHGTKTTVAAVAQRLRMSPANIYRFYPSKFALYDAVLEHVLEKSLKAAVANAERPVSASERLKDHVLGERQFMLDGMSSERELFGLMLLGIEQSWPAVENHKAQLRLIVLGLIQQGIEACEFAPQDCEFAADCFCASTAMLSHPAKVKGKTALERQITPKNLISFLIRALRHAECPKS